MDTSGSSKETSLGKQLIAAGWRMGMLLPPLLRGVVRLLPDEGEVAGEVHMKPQKGSPRHGFYYEYTGNPGTQLVICSQTCDIASDDEKLVEAMLVQVVTNATALAEMRRSSRRFVLDEGRGLVAYAPTRTFIDKKFLLAQQPQPGCKDQETLREFAFWVGRRYTRGAHPEAFVEDVRRPFFAKLSELRKAGDPRMASVDACKFRVFPPDDEQTPPPYDVDLFFVMPDDAMEGTPRAVTIRTDLASLAPIIQGALDPKVVSEFTWYAQPLNQMTAADFFDTDELPSD